MSDLEYNEQDYEVRILTSEDVTPEYVNWISDPEITLYSQNRYRTFTLDKQKEYVQEMLYCPNHHLYGLFHKELHIGNVLLGPIDWFNKLCDVRLVLGYKKYWGRSIMHYLGLKSFEMSFKNYPFFKLCVTIKSNNLPSIFAAKKAGFIKEGIRKSHCTFENTRVDLLEYAVFLEYGEVVKNN